MNAVPDGWSVARLGDLAETSLGKMLDAARPKGTTEVPYLRNLNVQWGHIDLDHVQTVALNSEEIDRFAVEPGDLLVCEGGEIGRSALWRGEREYMAYQKALHRVRGNGDLDLRYLRYLLEHYANTGLLHSRATGSTILHLPQRQLRELPVPHPPLTEQQRIVEILEDHLSRLDAASAALDTARRRLDALRASCAAGALRSEPGSVDTTMRLGDRDLPLPPDWRASTVGDEAELVEYGSGAKASEAESSEAVPVLRMGNIKDGIVVWDSLKFLPASHTDVQKLRLRSGDLLFNRTNSAEHVGKCAVFQGEREATFASYLIRARFCDSVNPQWARLVINSVFGRAYIKSVVSQQVGQANVNGTKLRAFPLPVPPRPVQDELLAKVVAPDQAARTLSDQIGRDSARVEALRRSLLAAAFSGRLTESTTQGVS